MRILDLFAGIGGFSLAAHWAGWETAAFVEWDKYPQKVLAKNFPGVPIYSDIKEFHYEKEKYTIGPVDVISGGFPCQPFSAAGKRQGTNDDRYLWPEMLRVIREVKPAWVVGENVAGLLTMDGGAVFEEVCASLEDEGYEVESFVLPAISCGAPHRRDRVWIVANARHSNEGRKPGGISKKNGRSRIQQQQPMVQFGGTDQTHGHATGYTDNNRHFTTEIGKGNKEGSDRNKEGQNKVCEPTRPNSARGFTASTDGSRWSETKWWPECSPKNTWEKNWGEHWYEVATRLCGIHDGLPSWVDGHRTNRLKALGNSIVPQVAYEIFKAINEVESV